MDKLVGYRTIIFNVGVAAIFVIRIIFPEALVSVGSWQTFTDAFWEFYAALVAFGNIVIRTFTTTPIFRRRDS